MSSNYTVVFDACVMCPAPLRSLLMYLALSGQFRARWSDDIHEEWIRNLLETRKNLTRSQLEKVKQLMNQHVPGAVVTNYKALIPLISLLDENDRHVVAAAIQTRAEAIVTFNLKDFPDHALSSYSLKAIHPDDFIADLMDLNTSCVLEAVRKHRAGLKNPPFTAEDYLDCLLKQRIPETVSRLSQFKLLF